MIYNLDKMEGDKCFFWTNAVGETSVPELPTDLNLSVSDWERYAPRSIQNLYKKFPGEGFWPEFYVMTVDGKDGILMTWLFNDFEEREHNKIFYEKLMQFAGTFAEKMESFFQLDVAYWDDAFGPAIGVLIPEDKFDSFTNQFDYRDDKVFGSWYDEFAKDAQNAGIRYGSIAA